MKLIPKTLPAASILLPALLLSLLAWPWHLPVALAEDRALLVGVGAYAMGATLPGIPEDIRNMKDTVRVMGFEEDQIKVLLDSRATLGNVKAAIRDWLIDGVSKDDRVVFYFSGHGSQIKDVSGDESDRADEVLLPYDVTVKEGGETLANVFLDDEFGTLLARIPAGEIFVFLDACHSGTATKGLALVLENAPVSKFFHYKGAPSTKGNFAVQEAATSRNDNYVALSACTDDEEALATKDGSLFTLGLRYAVMNGAKTGEAVTMSSLETRVGNHIADNLPPGAKGHHPILTGNSNLQRVNLIRDKQPPESGLWGKFETLAAGAAYKVAVSTNQKNYRVGDLLKITCRVKKDGYLNIISLDRNDQNTTVLFPNRLHPENRVSADATISIPPVPPEKTFVLRARPPVGKTMVVVLHTEREINAYRDGRGKAMDQFKTLSTKSFRGFEVEEKNDSGTFGAGLVVTEIYE